MPEPDREEGETATGLDAIEQRADDRLGALMPLLAINHRDFLGEPPGPRRINAFASRQSLALPSQMRTALYGDDDSFGEFAVRIARQRPARIVDAPGLFHEWLDEATFAATLERALWYDPQYAAGKVPGLLGYVSHERLADCVTIALASRNPESMHLSTLEGAALLPSVDRDLARRTVVRALETTPLLWQRFDVWGRAIYEQPDARERRAREEADAACARVGRLIAAGLATPEQIAENLDRRIARSIDFAHSWEGVREQAASEALAASALLEHRGVLVAGAVSRLEVARRTIRSSGISVYRAASLATDLKLAGIIDSSEHDELLDAIPAESLADRREIAMWRRRGAGMDTRNDTAVTTRADALTLLESSRYISPPDLRALLAGSLLQDSEKQALVAVLADEEPVSLLCNALTEAQPYLSGPEQAGRAIRACGESIGYVLPAWRQATAAAGWSEAEARSFLTETAEGSMSAATLMARELVDAKVSGGDIWVDPPLDLKRLTAVLISGLPAMSRSELFATVTDAEELVPGSTEGFFAAMRTSDAIEMARMMDPRLLSVVRLDDRITEVAHSGDYVERLHLVYRLPIIASGCSPDTVQAVVDWAVTGLTTGELATVVDALWPHATPPQRDVMAERILAIPAEAEAVFARGGPVGRVLRATWGRQLAPAQPRPVATLLEAVAPRSNRDLVRRLDGVPSEATVGHLMRSRAYLERLATECDADTLLAIRAAMPGRRPKQELRRLEAAALLGASTPSPEASADDIVAAAWNAGAAAAGVDVAAAGSLLARFRRERIDPVPMAIWVRETAVSERARTFMAGFLEAYARGVPMAEWKAASPSLVGTLPAAVGCAWMAEDIRHLDVASRRVAMLTTHSLRAVYDAGASPVENCLHYGYGQNQQGLPSLLCGDVKMFEARSTRDTKLGNSILRLGLAAPAQGAMLIEPLYASLSDQPDLAAAIDLGLVDAVFRMTEGHPEVPVALIGPHPEAMMRALRDRYRVEGRPHDFVLSRSPTPFGYNDVFGINAGERRVPGYVIHPIGG